MVLDYAGLSKLTALDYVDRNAIAQARLNNLEDDLGMTGTEFNTTVSMYGILLHHFLNRAQLTVLYLVSSSVTC